MKSRSIYSAAIIIALTFSGPSQAGKGGGGMGGPGHQKGIDMAPGQKDNDLNPGDNYPDTEG